MEDPLVKVHEKYDALPRDVFLSKIPFIIRYAPDHRIVPAYGLSIVGESGSRTKWVKVACLEDFESACRSYWREASGDIDFDRLCVFIMPYMPLRVAFDMHKKIVNAEILPDNFAEAVELRGAQVMDEAVDLENPMLGLEHEEKIGIIEFEDLQVLQFVVVNYGVLWHKAKAHCMLTYLCDHIDELMNKIEHCDQILGAPADETDLMITTVEEARRCLIFSMFQTGNQAANVHDAILSMYPAMHGPVYQHCQRCDQIDVEDPADTVDRLNIALTYLGFQENRVYPPIEDAQHNLMVAEGHSEFHDYNLNAHQGFANARNKFRNSLTPIIEKITLAGEHLTLMGVGGDPQGR